MLIFVLYQIIHFRNHHFQIFPFQNCSVSEFSFQNCPFSDFTVHNCPLSVLPFSELSFFRLVLFCFQFSSFFRFQNRPFQIFLFIIIIFRFSLFGFVLLTFLLFMLVLQFPPFRNRPSLFFPVRDCLVSDGHFPKLIFSLFLF